MHLIDMIHYWAKTDPHRLAFLQQEMATTYQGLADAIESIGNRIERLELDRREPIAVSWQSVVFPGDGSRGSALRIQRALSARDAILC